jgi:hypothetical protein
MFFIISSLAFIVVGKREGKKPLSRPTYGWENKVKVDLRELGWEGMECFLQAEDRDKWQAVVNMAVNLQVP